MNDKPIFKANLTQPTNLSKHYSGPVVITTSAVTSIISRRAQLLLGDPNFSNNYLLAERPTTFNSKTLISSIQEYYSRYYVSVTVSSERERERIKR